VLVITHSELGVELFDEVLELRGGELRAVVGHDAPRPGGWVP
jgi:ABC-type transport system involved in cytochrome bd biosynthesis fused ATPase/permease subunit